MTQRISLGYAPRAYQDHAHRKRRRWSVLVWHRGSGKTEWALMELLHEACTLPPNPRDPRRFAYVAPLRVQAQDVIWDRLLALALRVPGTVPHKQELRVTLPNGAIIQLYGADNPDRMRGITLDGCVLDEVAQMPPELFREVLLPALSRPDRQGWAVWIGTPKGRNEFCAIYERTRDAMRDGQPDTFADIQPASKTGVMAQSSLDAARAQMTADEYEQEFECSFTAALVGAYYAQDLAKADTEGRITRVPYDPGLPTVTAWDLGYGDSTAIWIVQQARLETRIIDHIEASGVGLDWYVTELRKRGYTYSETILPHDAAQGSVQTGKALVQTLRELGMPRCRVLERETEIEHAINEVRRMLPRCVFDAAKCAKGIEALRQYRRDWDTKGQVFKPKPRHDWTSHSCLTGDAMVATARGDVRIDAVRVGDEVWTPRGYALVTHAGPVKQVTTLVDIATPDGKSLHCTPEHKLLTQRGFVRADALRYTDRIYSGSEWQCRLIAWCSRVANIGYRATITGETTGEVRGHPTFTARYGKATTGVPSRMGMMSTMWTAILATMPWKILRLSGSLITSANTCLSASRGASSRPHLLLHSGWQLSGTPRRRGCDGIPRTARLGGLIGAGMTLLARTAVSRFARLTLRAPSGAIRIAKLRRYASAEGQTWVFDLSVESHACYQANGMLVSNSDAFRYLARGLRPDDAAVVQRNTRMPAYATPWDPYG